MSDKDKPQSATSSRSKYTPIKVTPSTSSAKIQLEFIPSPKKLSETNLSVKNLEDEEFPRGFTLLDTLSTSIKENDIQSEKDKQSEKEIQSEKDKLEYEPYDDLSPTISSASVDSRWVPLVSEYDELIRLYEEFYENDLTEEFIEFAEHQEVCRREWLLAVQECRRLQTELDKANHEIGDFAAKLKNARRLLDQEKKLRRRAEEEKFNLEQQMITARDLLSDSSRITDDTREKLSFLNNSNFRSHSSYSALDRNIVTTGTRLNTIEEVNSAEINSTASLLSEFSYSRSDGELDTSTVFKIKSEEWKKPNSIKKVTKSPKHVNSSLSTHKVVEINPNDKIVATTTLSLSKDGPITATSIIEAVPQSDSETSSTKTDTPTEKPTISPPRKEKPSSSTSLVKTHSFVSKTVICPDTCVVCKSRVRFGKIVVKCKECRSICHVECKNLLSVPCIPIVNTPTQQKLIGTLSDFTPTTPPMVPFLIIHCVNEIELRGMKEVGIYRIPGVEKDIKSLKEKFLRGKNVPNLSEIDVHVLCGVVKDFLRTLREPLVTYSLRKDFIQAGGVKDEMDAISCLYQAISQLPQPNRDTLAYIMLHLNRVAASGDCKMPASNLAKVFAPTIVGYSSQNIESHSLLKETKQQVLVMDHLMKIPNDFWSPYINGDSTTTTPRFKNMLGVKTPSTASLPKPSRRKFFSSEEQSSDSSARKRKRYFGTPPTSKK